MNTFTRIMTRFFQIAVALLVILLICHLPTVDAQDDVKYCQNLETGEIRVVRAGAPCPFPMAEM